MIMKIEIEKLFWEIDEEKLREKILESGGKLIKEKTLYKRVVKSFGEADGIYSWIRIRDEGDKVMMTLKKRKDDNSYSEEYEVEVSDFNATKNIFENSPIGINSYQENYREVYALNNCEIAIDIWPFLEPVCEIESESEEKVFETGKILDLDFEKSFNKNITSVYKMKYGKFITDLTVDKQKQFYFGAENPFD
jgi:predicted adenylyl cyclase CyaB